MYLPAVTVGLKVTPIQGAGCPMRLASSVGLAGLGSSSTQSIVLSTPSIIGGVLTQGGTTSIAATAWGAAAVPIIGVAVAGVTIGLMLLYSRKGPKQKVATTAIVNDVEPKLQANLEGFLAGPRTWESKEQALANFDAGWQWVVDNCDVAEMGAPGKACVADRQRGGKHDWFALYRDPIEQTVLGSGNGGNAGNNGGGNFAGGPVDPALVAMLALLAVGVML